MGGALAGERLSFSELLLTRVWLPIALSSSSQLPVVPRLQTLLPSAGVHRYCM